MIVGILGFLGFIACVIVAIISAVKKNGKVKKWIVGTVICFAVFVVAVAVSPPNDKTQTAANTQNIDTTVKATTVEVTKEITKEITTASVTSIQEKKTGIDPDAFDKAVKDEIAKIDTTNTISKIETRINSSDSNIAYVKLYLSDLSYWSGTDLTNKEFINTMGTLMDKIGIILNPNATIETAIYSPNGLLLGTRTMFGDTKLEN